MNYEGVLVEYLLEDRGCEQDSEQEQGLDRQQRGRALSRGGKDEVHITEGPTSALPGGEW